MVKPARFERLPAGIAATVMLVFLALPGAYCQETGEGEADYHNRQGVEYFKKGYYQHAPRKQEVEVEKNYGLAVREFKAAISRDFSCTEAHRNLARVFFVQNNFAGAATEYQTVVELAPSDLDAYVNLALALLELKRTDEAIRALENAKAQTSDPKSLASLESYLARVRAYQAQEAR